MLFTSIEFICFLLIVASIYYLLPHRFRWILLLGASYYFYMCWRPEYVLVLGGVTLVNFWWGKWITRTIDKTRRKRILAVGLCLNTGLLFTFKYLNFFSDSVKSLLAHFNIFYNFPVFQILLPVGVSYYTFKTISYLIDVYRENQEPEKHLGRFALYVSFFPEVTAGPIDRAGKLIPQFLKKVNFDYQQVTDGLKLMAWGFFKKLVIADRLAVYVDQVYNHLGRYEGIPLIMATYFFTFQIYCDFSGYTDIAIGAGKIMGFRLMENFNRPYLAKSIAEFWKRWHISFSSWLMDYLFLPIAYSVSRKIKTPKLLYIKAESWAYQVGIISTMLICGIWHGANWTFVVWGLLHGFYLAISFITKKARKKIKKRLKIKKNSHFNKVFSLMFTFHLVTFSWIFFRARSLPDALYVVKHLFIGLQAFIIKSLESLVFSLSLSPLRLVLDRMGMKPDEFVIAASALLLLFGLELLTKNTNVTNVFGIFTGKSTWVRWSFYYIIVFYIYLFGKFSITEFLYAQF